MNLFHFSIPGTNLPSCLKAWSKNSFLCIHWYQAIVSTWPNSSLNFFVLRMGNKVHLHIGTPHFSLRQRKFISYNLILQAGKPMNRQGNLRATLEASGQPDMEYRVCKTKSAGVQCYLLVLLIVSRRRM